MADMTTTSATRGSNADAYGSAAVGRALNDELDRNAFLNLLVTQMQNQDPMNPMQDREFITQLAQFSSLEQIQQLNSTMEAMAAVTQGSSYASLLGRTITAINPADGTEFTGKVSAVTYENGAPQLVIGEKKVDPGWVLRIE